MPPSSSIESKGDRFSVSDLPLAGSGGHVGLRGLFEGRLIVGITLFSTLGGFLVGYDQIIINNIVTMQSFGAVFPDIYMNEILLSWFVSTFLLAAMFGAWANGPICDKLGRKGDMKLNALIFLLGSSLQTGATSSSQLFAGRAISGLALGALTHTIPMYIAEISTANIRGSLISLQQLAIALGIIVGYWIAYIASYIGGIQCAPGVPYTGPLFDGIPTFDPYNDVPRGGCTGQTQASWRVPLGLQLFPALCLAVGMFFIPHSPRWLMRQGREEEALRTLSNLRKKSVDDRSVRFEFLEIMADIRYAREATNAAHPNAEPFKLLLHRKIIFFTTRKMSRRLFVGCLSLAFQQNMVSIIYLAPRVFALLGLEQKTTSVLIGLFGLVNILATLPTVIFVDRVGRRPLLISGAVGCFISLIVMGTLTTVYGKDLPVNGVATRAVIVFMFLFNICFSYSWGPIGWIIPNEIYPLHLRSTGLGYAVSGMWGANLTSVITAPYIQKYPAGLPYYITAVPCLFAFLSAMFLFPETKTFTLEEMDVAINKRVTDSEREHRVSIYQELGLPVRSPLTV